jgi:hypothetical protein
VGFGACVVLAVAVGAVASCRGEGAPPRSAGEEAPHPEDTKINRAHGEVKTELRNAAEKTQKAVNGLQQDIQRGAGRGADELGVRRNAAGIPRRASDAGS